LFISEVVTKYYCYEVIPGLITIDWDGMPCTVYVGAIGFFFVFCCIFGAGCCIACCSKKPPVDPDADMAGGGRGRGYVYLLFFSYKSKYEKQTTLGHYHIVRTLLYETINQKGTGTFEEKMYFINFFSK
jgi:hypothetical protein